MTLYEILDIIESAQERINELWNFFIWIHLSIIGGIALLRRRIGLIERVVVIVAYLGFMYLNRNAFLDAYAYLGLLQDAAASASGTGADAELVEFWRTFDLQGRIEIVPLIHPIAATVTVLAILVTNFIGRD